MNNLYLLVGPSGCGKTTLAKNLEKYHSLKSVVSYTTRPMRAGEINGTDHIFVTDKEFNSLGKMVAFTEFNGYRYGVTQKELDISDVYVIDPAGVDYLNEHIQGNRKVVTIGFLTSPDVCAKHMRARGDDEEKVFSRLAHDAKAFAGLPAYCDVMVDGSLNELELLDQVWAIIQSYEQTLTYQQLFTSLVDYISLDAAVASSDYVVESMHGAGLTDDQIIMLGLGYLLEENISDEEVSDE